MTKLLFSWVKTVVFTMIFWLWKRNKYFQIELSFRIIGRSWHFRWKLMNFLLIFIGSYILIPFCILHIIWEYVNIFSCFFYVWNTICSLVLRRGFLIRCTILVSIIYACMYAFRHHSNLYNEAEVYEARSASHISCEARNMRS